MSSAGQQQAAGCLEHPQYEPDASIENVGPTPLLMMGAACEWFAEHLLSG